ncbi:MAG: glycoside hydrolase family 130 protein [Gammaproteobacteria bacterium]|nr:glycoside hydrolase family 130 protein [Gammaproteobacteria bacterium]MDH3417192.1 glycoside hydrolase family 130 protein [Gammaproteobacteria bacterium]
MRLKEQRKQLVKRRSAVLNAESARVITRPHIPGDKARTKDLIDRVSMLNIDDVHNLLESVFEDYSGRHRNYRKALQRNYDRIAEFVPKHLLLSSEQQLLLGAYFTAEYSVEAAALFNPSVVPHPDQEGVGKGSQRFVMSFRATGEGHVSSIEFRSGIVDENYDIYFDPISQYVATPEMHTDPIYHRLHFRRKLEEMGAHDRITNHLLEGLDETFTFDELKAQIGKLRSTKFRLKDKHHAIDTVLWLARSNYEVIFRPDEQISERVIFPVSENESSGIEDARFVRFRDDDNSVIYYATYTAYNGFEILPQILETTDFLTFKMHTISGEAAQNKGMALFPRKVNGKFVMLSRQDGVNNYIMYSDSVRYWNEVELLQERDHPLEFVQVGNCGSPVETPEGWLTLFHGVGPMRRYSIWAELLDLDDPSQVVGRLHEPILTPDEHERDGYVPNVVYSCGSMIHGDALIIPYGIADQRCRVAIVSVSALLSKLIKN